MKEMSENEIMNLTANDFRDLSPEEKQRDDFRRMFQMLGLIYQNQVEIKSMLELNPVHTPTANAQLETSGHLK